MIVAAAFLFAGAGSLTLIARELCKAPEGYEDDDGFHTVHQDKGAKRGWAKTASSPTATRSPLQIRHMILWPAAGLPRPWIQYV
jgi:hypothetical protein